MASVSHVALATHALWHAAGRPNHPDFEPAGGRCWWCASPVDGSGWPVRLLPDTFPTPALARAKTASHLCRPCGWTMASGFALPRALADERLRARARPDWRGNRRTEVGIDGAPAEKRLVLELDDGRIGLWTPASPAAMEAAWADDPTQRTHPRDAGPVRYIGAYPIDRLAPGRESRFFVWHHLTLPDDAGRPRWRPMTDAEKPAIRAHLLRDDLDADALGATVLSVEKKHCAIHAAAERWAPGAPRIVWFAGQSIVYSAPTLARLIEAIEALVLAGARDEQIVTGHYPGLASMPLVVRQWDPIVRPHRGRALLDLALWLRRPVALLRTPCT